MYMEVFSDPVNLARYMRLHLGLTQQQVAQETGMSIQDIVRIERGQKNLEKRKYRFLADYYHLPADAIFNDEVGAALPMLSQRPNSTRKRFSRLSRRIQRQDELERAGEAYVAEQERQKLRGTPYAVGVNEAYADDPFSGYDIFSFTQDGEPVFITVKTTRSGAGDPFMLSDNELEVAEYCCANSLNYELHLVYHMNSRRGAPSQIVYNAGQVLSFIKEPTEYIVWRR